MKEKKLFWEKRNFFHTGQWSFWHAVNLSSPSKSALKMSLKKPKIRFCIVKFPNLLGHGLACAPNFLTKKLSDTAINVYQMLYSSVKNLHFAKQVLLLNILLQLPTVHYGCYSQDILRCELYTVSTTWLFFSISHLPIMWVAQECQVARLVMGNANFSRNCTTSI